MCVCREEATMAEPESDQSGGEQQQHADFGLPGVGGPQAADHLVQEQHPGAGRPR